MRDLALDWYAMLGSLNAAAGAPLTELGQSLGIPIVAVLLLGLLGATSPCQLTTNLSALAYVARGAADRRVATQSALAYLLGKALVYTIFGAAVIFAGQQLAQGSVPVIVVARRALGPLMILLGLYLLGVVPLRFTLGQGLSNWVQTRAGVGTGGAFVLGTAFSFAFCPTLFLLFFGLTIPMALRSPAGILYPGIFALGTTLPLLVLAALLGAGLGSRKGYLVRTRRIEAWLRRGAAFILLLAGISDTFTYWFL